MPWSYPDNVPASMKYLKPSIQKKGIAIANHVLETTGDEGKAIAIGISKAKSVHDKKSLVKLASQENSEKELLYRKRKRTQVLKTQQTENYTNYIGTDPETHARETLEKNMDHVKNSLKRNETTNLENVAKRHIKYKKYILKRNLKRAGLVGGAALAISGAAAAYLHYKKNSRGSNEFN